jgi:hypothetical protein
VQDADAAEGAGGLAEEDAQLQQAAREAQDGEWDDEPEACISHFSISWLYLEIY